MKSIVLFILFTICINSILAGQDTGSQEILAASQQDSRIALYAFIVSVVSISIGFLGLLMQRIHNRKSILPIGIIGLADYENCLRIRISNNGVGPMIIKICETRKNGEIRPYPIDWFEKSYEWRTFRKGLENHAIIAGDHVTLLEFSLDPNDKLRKIQRDEIRSILKDLEIVIIYEDVYGNSKEASRRLDWFGRTIVKS